MALVQEAQLLDLVSVGLTGFCLLTVVVGYVLVMWELRSHTPSIQVMVVLKAFTANMFYTSLVALLAILVVLSVKLWWPQESEGERYVVMAEGMKATSRADVGVLQTESSLAMVAPAPLDVAVMAAKMAVLEGEGSESELPRALVSAEDSPVAPRRSANERWSIEDVRAELDLLDQVVETYGGTINTMWPFDESKRKVNQKIQRILAVLAFHSGECDGDPMQTSAALVRYQKARGFAKTGYFGSVTIASMRDDVELQANYLSTAK